MKNTDKITMTYGQLTKLIKEAKLTLTPDGISISDLEKQRKYILRLQDIISGYSASLLDLISNADDLGLSTIDYKDAKQKYIKYNTALQRFLANSVSNYWICWNIAIDNKYKGQTSI